MVPRFWSGLLNFTYNFVKHIDIFIKNLVWATSLNFPISIPEKALFLACFTQMFASKEHRATFFFA
jgi:hypothetical protein